MLHWQDMHRWASVHAYPLTWSPPLRGQCGPTHGGVCFVFFSWHRVPSTQPWLSWNSQVFSCSPSQMLGWKAGAIIATHWVLSDTFIVTSKGKGPIVYPLSGKQRIRIIKGLCPFLYEWKSKTSEYNFNWQHYEKFPEKHFFLKKKISFLYFMLDFS